MGSEVNQILPHFFTIFVNYSHSKHFDFISRKKMQHPTKHKCHMLKFRTGDDLEYISTSCAEGRYVCVRKHTTPTFDILGSYKWYETISLVFFFILTSVIIFFLFIFLGEFSTFLRFGESSSNSRFFQHHNKSTLDRFSKCQN